MRSVVVVLPASMWAAIPMLRTLSSGIVRATATSFVLPSNGLNTLLDVYTIYNSITFFNFSGMRDEELGIFSQPPPGTRDRGIDIPAKLISANFAVR
jgi:hypothetical protein